MSDSVKTEVFLDFNVPAISQGFDDGLLVALEQAAQMGLDKSRSIFQRKTQSTGTGEMESTFFEFKSFSCVLACWFFSRSVSSWV